MPRRSAVALSVVHLEPDQKRPRPPSNLDEESAEVWRVFVDSMPPDWFPVETHPMLSQLCRLVIRARDVSNAIDEAKRQKKNLSEREYQNLMRVEMQISDAIARLSTKMRLTQQSSAQYDKKRKREGKPEVPWDTIKEDGEDED